MAVSGPGWEGIDIAWHERFGRPVPPPPQPEPEPEPEVEDDP